MATLCIDCAKAAPQLCQWIGTGDRSGLKYESKINRWNAKKNGELITVTECKRYKKGQLPPLGGMYE